jgi:lipopolysaccharide exporter
MPIRRAMYPSLAKLTSRPEDFGQAVVVAFSAIAASCLFIGACLMSTAPEFVAVVLGQKWIEAVPVFRWLAIFGAFSGLVLMLEVPIWVSGRTSMSAIQTWLELALIAPLAWMAVRQYGVEGAAAARVAVAAVMVPLMMMLTARIDGVRFLGLVGALWRPLLAALVMALAAEPITGAWHSALLTLVVKLALCLLVYPSVLLMLWTMSGRPDGMERSALGYIRLYVSTRRAA